ncbi:MAG: hypothetical protein ACRCST_02780, partial [Turicibacter sp.]
EGSVELPVVKSEDTEVSVWTPDSKGCPFRNRCPVAESRCAEHLPEAKEVEVGQFIRCVHAK